jgi:hypothetical protein
MCPSPTYSYAPQENIYTIRIAYCIIHHVCWRMHAAMQKFRCCLPSTAVTLSCAICGRSCIALLWISFLVHVKMLLCSRCLFHRCMSPVQSCHRHRAVIMTAGVTTVRLVLAMYTSAAEGQHTLTPPSKPDRSGSFDKRFEWHWRSVADAAYIQILPAPTSYGMPRQPGRWCQGPALDRACLLRTVCRARLTFNNTLPWH